MIEVKARSFKKGSFRYLEVRGAMRYELIANHGQEPTEHVRDLGDDREVWMMTYGVPDVP